MQQISHIALSLASSSSGWEETEAGQRLLEWNRTAAPYPRDESLCTLFEARAAETPDAPALLSEVGTMTYGELNRRSNRLAHGLRRLSVGPEVPVAVCLERSPERIVALLAILKAGGAYLPLDPDTPKARLQLLLEDAGVEVLVTQRTLDTRLPEAKTRILLDADTEQFAAEPDTNPVSGVSADNLAYLLFTSGSTGTPKGVMVAHRAIVRLVCNTDYVRLEADEVVLQLAPLAFDASTFEIWGALLNGATLAVMPPSEASPDAIGAAVARWNVSTLWLTAGLFHQMVDGPLETLRGVRQLLAGGDVLAVPQVRKAFAALPGCRLINGYGPTECTTFACCFTVDADSLSGPSIPIGRPIANTRAYILDERQCPVSVGTAGELYIGGDGVARGYLNHPELTAEKFLPDPFGTESGARMYRTGDRVRWLPDGHIEFLGRIDQQVKIRGFRIEPGEIEAVLTRHPAIRTAVVLVEGDTAEDKRLTAYITTEPSLVPTVRELRTFLKAELPEYMIPALFRRPAALPLTPNGKVDRNALRQSAAEPLPSGVEYAAPHSALEQTVAQVWQEVLSVETVGLHENFFDSGGDSLRLIRVHRRLQDALQREFPLTDLFQYPTVRTLAAHLQSSAASGSSEAAGTLPARQQGVLDRAARQKDALRRQMLAKGNRKDD